jgi:O-antigen/teichoic acid export membrane protein
MPAGRFFPAHVRLSPPAGLPWGGLWSLADQSLISASHFLTTVLLARTLEPRAFGVFILVYTVLLFWNEVQKALITRPHNAVAATLSGSRYAAFTTTAALTQAVFAALLGGSAVAIGLFALVSGWEIALLLLVVGPALLAWQLQEFARQTFYTRGDTHRAFGCDLVSYGGQTALILILYAQGALSGAGALLALATASALSGLLAFWLIRHDFSRPSREAFRQMWRFGRWLLGDGLGNWLSSQLYPLLTAAVVGASGIAILRAVQNLIAPGHVIMNAFVAYTVPRAARIRASGGVASMKSFLWRASLIAGAPLALYWLAVSLLAGPVLRLLYGETYASYGPLVGLMALGYAVLHVTHGQTAALLAIGRTNVLFRGRLVAIFITFSAGIALVWWLGVYGAAIGTATSLAGLSAFLAYSLASGQAEPLEAEPAGTLGPAGMAVEGRP